MPKIAKELSASEVKRLTWAEHPTKGRSKTYHAVGGVAGLLLQCSPPTANNKIGARSWILRVTIEGKRKDLGLGGYPDVTLAQARENARDLKQSIRSGNDPLEEKIKRKREIIKSRSRLITFDNLADDYLALKEKEYKSTKQFKNLTSWLDRFVRPVIGNMVIADIDVNHILKILNPIWEKNHDTAQRVRLHTEKIFKSAIVRELGITRNPAVYRDNLEHLLVSSSKLTSLRENFPALPYIRAPYFWSKLVKKNSIGALALRFLILTASRPGAVMYMKWSEIDWKTNIWTLPANRELGKVTKDHKVPLTQEALKTLTLTHTTDSEYVFTFDNIKPISNMTMNNIIKRLNQDELSSKNIGFVDPDHNNKLITSHGFRSSFKDWSREQTSYPDEASELALSHVNNDKTRAAYARSQLIDIRWQMMSEWASFLTKSDSQ